jgi:antiviral helicase SKI2
MDGSAPSPASELSFCISFSGHSGHLRLDPTLPPSTFIPDFVPVPAQPTTSPKITRVVHRNL